MLEAAVSRLRAERASSRAVIGRARLALALALERASARLVPPEVILGRDLTAEPSSSRAWGLPPDGVGRPGLDARPAAAQAQGGGPAAASSLSTSAWPPSNGSQPPTRS